MAMLSLNLSAIAEFTMFGSLEHYRLRSVSTLFTPLNQICNKVKISGKKAANCRRKCPYCHWQVSSLFGLVHANLRGVSLSPSCCYKPRKCAINKPKTTARKLPLDSG
jgi:hypothetical protein